MRKITNREKFMIGFGALAAIGIIVYFLILPFFTGDQKKAGSDLKAKQEKIESLKKLKAIEPLITDLESTMRTQLGYSQMSFNKDTAEPTIMKYLAQIANQSEIREIEQLDVKPEKSKKKQTTAQKDDQNTLKSIVDRLYTVQLLKEKDSSFQLDTKESSSSSDDKAVRQVSDTEKSNESDKNKSIEETEQKESSESSWILFPIMPKDVPIDVKRAFVGYVQTHSGQNPISEDLDNIIDSAGVKDKEEKDKIIKKLNLYNDRVKQRKGEVFGLINKMDIIKNTKSEDKVGRFTAKMVFKSEITQLVKLLYNLQTSAKWIKIDSIQINVADRQKGILAVEMSMTATALYEGDKKDENERM